MLNPQKLLRSGGALCRPFVTTVRHGGHAFADPPMPIIDPKDAIDIAELPQHLKDIYYPWLGKIAVHLYRVLRLFEIRRTCWTEQQKIVRSYKMFV